MRCLRRSECFGADGEGGGLRIRAEVDQHEMFEAVVVYKRRADTIWAAAVNL